MKKILCIVLCIAMLLLCLCLTGCSGSTEGKQLVTGTCSHCHGSGLTSYGSTCRWCGGSGVWSYYR